MGQSERREGELPPGQRLQRGWPVTHYGPVPRFKPERWEFQVFGATADGGKRAWGHEEFAALPYTTVMGDFHCVTRFSMLGVEWGGVSAAEILRLAPPAPDVTHVMVWAEYGFSSNLRLADFADPQSIFATHRGGEPLTAEHGFPVRLIVPRLYAWKGPKWVRGVEYMTSDRRGFWEERGYHNIGDPWSEQRYSYQEEPGDGPEL
ncbi:MULTISPECIES: sulfite oxidase-like oxidoreductase [Streptomycetaceae]|uniref:sulfite oxidase-like oxidoreductase n=1 Tax=Streptomycetaceae TaxID=2062 RepID=UPI00036AF13F|nr:MULTISPECIES: sulfite oxidase-like oxidoreductase [Streptomycetaceae]MDX2852819.1 sulfite oxidase-like oxidoreductase [Streptomyces sp. PA03-3a]MYX32496.1 molybdopterin-dependent oxidoreductase [Streptomyces sp. SID8377]